MYKRNRTKTNLTSKCILCSICNGKWKYCLFLFFPEIDSVPIEFTFTMFKDALPINIEWTVWIEMENIFDKNIVLGGKKYFWRWAPDSICFVLSAEQREWTNDDGQIDRREKKCFCHFLVLLLIIDSQMDIVEALSLSLTIRHSWTNIKKNETKNNVPWNVFP